MKFKRSIQSLFILAILFFVSACSPFTKVYSIEEPGANLSKYHTYNWLADMETHDGNKGPAWLTASTQERIRMSTEKQMGQYGFKACTENPDLMLHYHVVIENKVYYIRDKYCVEENGLLNGRCDRLKEMHYREGTLIIDFIDTKSSNQVWRGVAVGVLENIRPSEVASRIDKAIAMIFEKFPEKPIPAYARP